MSAIVWLFAHGQGDSSGGVRISRTSSSNLLPLPPLLRIRPVRSTLMTNLELDPHGSPSPPVSSVKEMQVTPPHHPALPPFHPDKRRAGRTLSPHRPSSPASALGRCLPIPIHPPTSLDGEWYH